VNIIQAISSMHVDEIDSDIQRLKQIDVNQLIFGLLPDIQGNMDKVMDSAKELSKFVKQTSGLISGQPMINVLGLRCIVLFCFREKVLSAHSYECKFL
jgi:hypothetical protein